MAGEPDVGVGVAFGDVVVEVASGEVVVALLAERFDKTGVVAGVGGRHAVTDRLPEVLSALTTAAGSE